MYLAFMYVIPAVIGHGSDGLRFRAALELPALASTQVIKVVLNGEDE